MRPLYTTRIASLVLVIGFFFACSSSKPTIDSLISENQFDLALEQIETELSENPDQPGLLIQKGKIMAQMAESSAPEARFDQYMTAVTSFEEAIKVGADSTQEQDISSTLHSYWVFEHNTGTAVFEDEMVEQRLAISSAHFNNAIVLKPGEASSYLSLATTEYTSGELSSAISTLNRAKNTLSEVPEALYENLGFLLLQNGEPDQAVFYYELANTNVAANKNIAFGLINAYISTENTEKAVALLESMVKNNPNDASLRNVYGTQLYLIVEGIIQDLNAAYQSNDSLLVNQLKFEAEGVGEQAEQELIQSFSRDSSNVEYIESLAVFYNNLTANYLFVYESAFDSDKPILLNKAGTLLDFAIEYYTKLARLEPGNGSVASTIESLNKLKENRFTP